MNTLDAVVTQTPIDPFLSYEWDSGLVSAYIGHFFLPGLAFLADPVFL